MSRAFAIELSTTATDLNVTNCVWISIRTENRANLTVQSDFDWKNCRKCELKWCYFEITQEIYRIILYFQVERKKTNKLNTQPNSKQIQIFSNYLRDKYWNIYSISSQYIGHPIDNSVSKLSMNILWKIGIPLTLHGYKYQLFLLVYRLVWFPFHRLLLFFRLNIMVLCVFMC